MNVVLGIDGGGTRTRASIVADEQVLAFAESGSIKRLRVGAQKAEEHLRALLGEVYKQAGVTGVCAATVGVASATMPGVTEWITAVLGRLRREDVRGCWRRSHRTRCSVQGWPGHFADRGDGLEYHWARSRRRARDGRRVELKAG